MPYGLPTPLRGRPVVRRHGVCLPFEEWAEKDEISIHCCQYNITKFNKNLFTYYASVHYLLIICSWKTSTFLLNENPINKFNCYI